MKNILNLIVVAFMFIVVSCNKKFEDLLVNPNAPISVPPDLIFNGLIDGLSNGLGEVKPWGAVHRYNQYFCRNFEYYGDNQYNWNGGPFNIYTDVFKNISKMELEAEKIAGNKKTPYHIVAKFFKAYYYYNLTSMMGDIPLSEANQAGESLLQPKYDSQKEVFLQILKWLDEANSEFKTLASSTESIKGDIFYNGDYSKWRKLINTYKLRILIALSKKDSDPDLKIKQQFFDLIGKTAEYPLFEAASENFSYKYNDKVNIYPLNPVDYGFNALRYNMAETYVKNSTDIRDPRILITCEPAWALVNGNNWAPTDFNAYVAPSTGESLGTMEGKAFSYQICHINRYRYFRTNTAEDFTIVGYPEMCFNIAEAINRGWATGDAEAWYKKGIQASLSFFGIKDGKNPAHYLPIGKSLGQWLDTEFDFDFANYYNQSKVKYEAGAAGLNKILVQKYLAFFQNSGWEAYFNFRRTGVPAFSGGVGIGNNGKLPKRWSYPSYENQRNKTNYQAAVKSQFGGNDDINAEMWLIK